MYSTSEIWIQSGIPVYGACSVAQSCWTLIHDMISRKKGKIERGGNKTEK